MIKAIATYLDGKTQEKETVDDAYRFFGLKLNHQRPVKVEIWGMPTWDLIKSTEMAMHPLHEKVIIIRIPK